LFDHIIATSRSANAPCELLAGEKRRNDRRRHFGDFDGDGLA
jgi:hypothetical protein